MSLLDDPSRLDAAIDRMSRLATTCQAEVEVRVGDDVHETETCGVRRHRGARQGGAVSRVACSPAERTAPEDVSEDGGALAVVLLVDAPTTRVLEMRTIGLGARAAGRAPRRGRRCPPCSGRP